MKLKTAKNLIEAERTAYEQVARMVGVTDFSRTQHGGYSNWGTAMDFRIWMGAKDKGFRA